MINDRLTLILQSLRSGLGSILSHRLAEVYLYGSQARGDATQDSDVDVLVVINGEFDYFDLVLSTSKLASELSLQYETVISLAFTSVEDFRNKATPMLMNVHREGIPV